MTTDPLANIRAALDSFTRVVVCNPQDAISIRAAARQPDMPLIEVVEDKLCPVGTAYTFPKGGGTLGSVNLPTGTARP